MVRFHVIKKLDTFTLDAKAEISGGVIVIQGKSGAGKTTLLNLISGLVEPDEGSVKVGDWLLFEKWKNTQSEKKQRIVNVPVRKRNVGYVFQNYLLFPNMTVQQNIYYGIMNDVKDKKGLARKKREEYALHVMETFGILHLAQKKSNEISGGEKQRAALARAVVTDPALLLLDEPFSALDEYTKEEIYQEFLDMKKAFKIPTILVTHNQEESQLLGDRTLYMVNGALGVDI